MAKDKLLAQIAAIVCALDETNGAPESMLYIFLDMNMDLWSKVRDILVESGLIKIQAHYVTLTASGKETAQKLNKTIQN